MKIFALNWKMQKSYQESIAWIYNNNSDLKELSKLHNIIICPSYETLCDIKKNINYSNIFLGAQDCSEHESGAYTGQVSAKSLAEIGIKFCIVGHSETKIYLSNYYLENNINIIIAKKSLNLFKNNITPIICIGETKEEKLNNQTFEILENQINPIIEILKINNYTDKNIIIAYEPIWSIGTGQIPDKITLTNIINYIKNYIKNQFSNIKIKILYGGSVGTENILDFKNIEYLDGFLIGKASLDFQMLKKIVLLFSREL